jgi:CHAD domain-containing protein
VLLKPKLSNFHKLRIQFKKLRYASEFFNPAFDNRLSMFIADVVKIQDCLGELQDTVFTKELIVNLLKKWKGSVMDPRLLFILGEMYQLQQEIASARQARFYEIWKQFDREETIVKLTQALDSGKTQETQEG